LDFSDDLGTAAQYAEAAMQLMDQHNVPSTPQNFMIWYAYASGSNPDLKNTLDDLVSDADAVSQEDSAEIFDRYFSQFTQGKDIQKTGSEMSDLVGEVMSLVNQATDDAEVFGAALEDSVGSLTNLSDPSALGHVVKLLADNTQKMLSQNRQLQGKLENSSEEIQKNFDMVLQSESEAAAQKGTPLALVLIDIDHFKKFNDTHGHQTGDHVLKFVGAMLKKAVKASDLPARYGGEEFALVLPNTDLSSAVALAESIRVAVAGKRLRKKQTGDDIGNITMSLGVSQYRPGESLSALIKRADDGLYQAKGLGRNQVVAETELSAVAD
jgi:diguanylate cyclase